MNDKLKIMVHTGKSIQSISGIAHRQRVQMDELYASGKGWSWSPNSPCEAIYLDTLGHLGCSTAYETPAKYLNSVTVVIPTHRTVPIGINGFLDDPAVHEIIILANGTTELHFDPHPRVRIHRCPWEGHGRTRQASVELVKSPFILFSVDDASPVGMGAVSRLVSQLEQGNWDATVARQLPWPSAPLYLHRRLREWMPAGQCTIDFPQTDHVATVYRRETLIESPLPDVSIAEDLMWSHGKSVGLVQNALFIHSHQPSVRSLWTREVNIEGVRCQLNQSEPIHLTDLALRSFGAAFRRDWASLIYEGTEASAQWYAQRKFKNKQPSA